MRKSRGGGGRPRWGGEVQGSSCCFALFFPRSSTGAEHRGPRGDGRPSSGDPVFALNYSHENAALGCSRRPSTLPQTATDPNPPRQHSQNSPTAAASRPMRHKTVHRVSPVTPQSLGIAGEPGCADDLPDAMRVDLAGPGLCTAIRVLHDPSSIRHISQPLTATRAAMDRGCWRLGYTMRPSVTV